MSPAPRALTAVLEEGIDRGFFPGASAVVLADGHPLAELHLGDARVAPPSERAPVTSETLWDLAELTRPIAAAATILGLAHARLLSLEDPLARFHDLYRKTKFEGVTVRRLLAHSAGLMEWFPCYVRGEGRAAYRRTLADLDPAAPPGGAVVPSSPGYLLLADVAERALTSSLDTWFAERVAGPLGLANDLRFFPEGEAPSRAAGGEKDDATERARVAKMKLRYAGFRTGFVNDQVNDGNAYRRAAGVSLNAGLFGTARAVAAIGQAWLDRDARLLPEGLFEEAIRESLGWRRDDSAPSSFGETGTTGTSLLVDPESRRVLVLLTNRLHPHAREFDMDGYLRRFHETGLAIS